MKKDAKLWNFDFTDWSDAEAIVARKKGFVFHAVAIAENSVGGRYYMTSYAWQGGKIRYKQGFNVADCKPYKEGNMDKLKAELKRIKRNSNELKTKVESQTSTITRLANQAEKLNARVDSLEKDKTNLTVLLDECRGDLVEAEKDNKRLKNKVNNQERQMIAIQWHKGNLNTLGKIFAYLIKTIGIKK